jgi:hypothetical protein
MLRTYAAWIKGAKPEDIERIKAAMTSRPSTDGDGTDTRRPLAPPKLAPAAQIEGASAAIVTPERIAAATPSGCLRKGIRRRKCEAKVAGVEGFEPPYGGIKRIISKLLSLLSGCSPPLPAIPHRCH